MPKWIDLTGKKINKLLVIDGNLKHDRTHVLAICDCGRELLVNKSNLLKGRTKSCGQGICHVEFKDLTGKQFGFLKVIKLIGKHHKRNINIWKCECVCGNMIESYSDRLETGNTQSCGCKRIEITSKKTTKPNNKAYTIQKWYSYKCHSEKHSRVFELSFEEFENLIYKECYYCGTLPLPTKSNGIDRIDNDIGYILLNCVTACKDCNYAKRKLSYSDFIALAKRIVKVAESRR